MENEPSCNVSSKLNFTVGVLATIAACVIGYFAYSWLVAH